jgi:uncharacterized protein YdhG (YjbR/CyaY superfamily)
MAVPTKPKTPSKTFDSYAGGFPPDVELALHQIRDIILDAVPDAEFSIKYTMPLFTRDDFYIYVAGWKKHIGLYPIHRAPPALEKLIAPYRSAKDTVRFFYSKPIPYDLVTKIVRARLSDPE